MKDGKIWEKLRVPTETKNAVMLGKGYKDVKNLLIALDDVQDTLKARQEALKEFTATTRAQHLARMIREGETARLIVSIPIEEISENYQVFLDIKEVLEAEQRLMEIDQALPHVAAMQRNLEAQAVINGQAEIAEHIKTSEPLTALSLKEVSE